ncbi:hypothetical protein EON81_29670, partial [bacterium]
MRWLPLLFAAALPAISFAGDIQVYQVDTMTHRAAPGIPGVSDPFVGVRGMFRVVGPLNGQRVIVRVRCADQTAEWRDVAITQAGEYWWWGAFYCPIDGPVPIEVEVDAAGMSGDTNVANNRLSSTYTPIYPARALEFYGDKRMEILESRWARFAPNSGTIGRIEYLFADPCTTSSQGPNTDYVPPANSQRFVTNPNGTAVYRAQWLNLDTATTNRPYAAETFKTTLRNSRVNPNEMNKVPWTAIDAPLDAETAIWRRSESWVATSAPEITELINLCLPANYRQTMTPWEAAKRLFLGPAKRLTYDKSIFRNPLQAWRDSRG